MALRTFGQTGGVLSSSRMASSPSSCGERAQRLDERRPPRALALEPAEQKRSHLGRGGAVGNSFSPVASPLPGHEQPSAEAVQLDGRRRREHPMLLPAHTTTIAAPSKPALRAL